MNYRSIFRPGLFDGQPIIITGDGAPIDSMIADMWNSMPAWTTPARRAKYSHEMGNAVS